jgi:hypothetical protein
LRIRAVLSFTIIVESFPAHKVEQIDICRFLEGKAYQRKAKFKILAKAK